MDKIYNENDVWIFEDSSSNNIRKLGCIPPIDRGLSLSSGYSQLTSIVNTITVNEARELIDDGVGDNTNFFDAKFVHDQKQTNACCGFATALAIEKARFLNGQEHIRLSGASVYSQINRNVDQGALLKDGMRAAATKGAVIEELWPTNAWREDMASSEARSSFGRFIGHEPIVIDNELELLTAMLVLKTTPVVAVHVDSNFNRLDSNDVIQSGPGVGNHAVNLDSVRWNTQANRFEYRLANSWGTNWGRGGFAWITWPRHMQSCRVHHEFYCLTSVIEDPKNENPPKVQ